VKPLTYNEAQSLTYWVRRFYKRWIRPRISDPIKRQRLNILIYLVWGYWPLLFISNLSLADKLRLLGRFIRIDWNVLLGHWPCEIARICKVLVTRSARPNEVVVEAGCWEGGSAAKFSIICKMLGYQLHIYDSFEGVETMTLKEKEQGRTDFSGQFAATERVLRSNLIKYGEIDVCHIHKGWFAETLAVTPVPNPVRIVYIDCDLAKGTYEVLLGVVPNLVKDGWIFSQDYHIEPVQDLLHDPETWKAFGRGLPTIKYLCGKLASLRFIAG
jgi:O-methyltransferase